MAVLLDLLDLPVPRGIANKRLKYILNIILISLICLVCGFYFFYSYFTIPSVTKNVDYKDLISQNKNLYEYGCSCQNKNIRVGTFVTTNFSCSQTSLTDTNVQIYCQTTTTKMEDSIKGSWSINADFVLSQDKIFNEINNTIGTWTFDSWNNLASNLRINEQYLLAMVNANAMQGDKNQIKSVSAATYNTFMNNKWTIVVISEMVLSSMQVDYAKYIDVCEPINCTITESGSIITWILLLPSFIGGCITTAMTFGNFVLGRAEDHTLDKLFKKFLEGNISQEERKFLQINSGEYATQMDVIMHSPGYVKPKLEHVRTFARGSIIGTPIVPPLEIAYPIAKTIRSNKKKDQKEDSGIAVVTQNGSTSNIRNGPCLASIVPAPRHPKPIPSVSLRPNGRLPPLDYPVVIPGSINH